MGIYDRIIYLKFSSEYLFPTFLLLIYIPNQPRGTMYLLSSLVQVVQTTLRRAAFTGPEQLFNARAHIVFGRVCVLTACELGHHRPIVLQSGNSSKSRFIVIRDFTSSVIYVSSEFLSLEC